MKLETISEQSLEQVISKLLIKADIKECIKKVERFIDKELDKIYDTYLVSTDKSKYVVKKFESIQEKIVYENVFKGQALAIPKQYVTLEMTKHDLKEEYVLMEYIEGKDLRWANQKTLESSIKALAKIHRVFLGRELGEKVRYDYEYVLENQIKRDQAALAKASVDKNSEGIFKKFYQVYQLFVNRYMEAPRTLNHGDLLPINVIANEQDVKIIDWAYGHSGPYMRDIARLVCHEVEKEKYFIPQEYHEGLIDLYYTELCKSEKFKVGYEQYRQDVLLAMFQEKSYYVIWTLREPNEEKDKVFYDVSFEASKELVQEILKD